MSGTALPEYVLPLLFGLKAEWSKKRSLALLSSKVDDVSLISQVFQLEQTLHGRDLWESSIEVPGDACEGELVMGKEHIRFSGLLFLFLHYVYYNVYVYTNKCKLESLLPLEERMSQAPTPRDAQIVPLLQKVQKERVKLRIFRRTCLFLKNVPNEIWTESRIIEVRKIIEEAITALTSYIEPIGHLVS